jgi:RecB family endonuclease NucS
MNTSSYRHWLELQKYQENTINTQIARIARVEQCHGDLDEHYAKDRMLGLIDALSYSNADQRQNRPNPSKIPIDGDIRTNLASYRDAVKRYVRFLVSGATESTLVSVPDKSEKFEGQRIGLERDMQAALRINIHQLESGISVIDDGAERSVDSGFIDITARDISGAVVVIELKAGRAGRDAVGQILSYMGDIALEDDGVKVRGILVASDFDCKARAAARMVPNLILRKYSVQFTFADGHE